MDSLHAEGYTASDMNISRQLPVERALHKLINRNLSGRKTGGEKGEQAVGKTAALRELYGNVLHSIEKLEVIVF